MKNYVIKDKEQLMEYLNKKDNGDIVIHNIAHFEDKNVSIHEYLKVEKRRIEHNSGFWNRLDQKYFWEHEN